MNPVLQSESFERAAHSLRDTGESLARTQGWFSDNAETIRNAQANFDATVNKLIRAMGMHAENMQRQAVGASMAYTESAFEGLL
jgi:hypothetical protein